MVRDRVWRGVPGGDHRDPHRRRRLSMREDLAPSLLPAAPPNYIPGPGDVSDAENGGMWLWMRSPEQERRVVMSLFNRYCIRCHGVDGRGVWDIPDVPDFTNTAWQATRPDSYRTRVILQGRGAVMPAFRGTLTLEEACAMARYLHTFVPGSQPSRPDLSEGNTGNKSAGSQAARQDGPTATCGACSAIAAWHPGPFHSLTIFRSVCDPAHYYPGKEVSHAAAY